MADKLMKRACKAVNENGQPCRQAPLIGKDFCYWHDPENERDANEARRMGALTASASRFWRPFTRSMASETIPQIQRFIEIAQMGNLALDNSVPRNRAIIAGALAAARLHEIGELAKKIEQIESVLEARLPKKEEKRRKWGLF